MSRLQKGNSHYITGLDGLRALALIAVVAYHLDISGIPGGFLGVDIFFVLSGFLVTDLLITHRKRDNRLNLADFWFRRFRRLLPALIFMLIIVVAWVTLLDRSLLPSLRGDVLATAVYGNNWWLIFHQVSYFDRFSDPAPFVHLWSLSVEGQFYIVWPLLLALGLRYTPKRIQMVGITLLLALTSILTMALMYEPGSDPSRIYYGTDTRVFALLIGATLAMLLPSHTFVKNRTARARQIFGGMGWLGLAILLYQFTHLNEFDDFVYRGGLVIAAVAAAMVVASLLHPRTMLSKLMSSKPLRWIGLRSYGIYLWHYPIIQLTKPAVNTDGFNWTLAVIQVAASVLLAAFSYKYIEEPIRRGAISKGWKQIRGRKWTLNQLSLKHWVVSTCATVILIVFTVGMIAHIPVTAATSDAIISDPNLTEPPATQEEVLGPVYPDTSSSQPNNGNLASEKKPSKSDTESEGQETKSTAGSDTSHKPDKPSTGTNSDAKDDSSSTSNAKWSTVTAIGDSVMLDGKPYLEKMLPGIQVDAEIGRQMSTGSKLLTQLENDGKLGNIVIIGLGTNGAFNKKQLESCLNSLESVDHIIFVNSRVPRKWESTVNRLLDDLSTSMPNATIVDWYSASAHHDDYFGKDGVHLTAKGAEAYASLIADTLKAL